MGLMRLGGSVELPGDMGKTKTTCSLPPKCGLGVSIGDGPKSDLPSPPAALSWPIN